MALGFGIDWIKTRISLESETPLIMWKRCLHLVFVVFYQIFFELADNEDKHKISDEFQFRPDRINPYRVRYP